MARSDLIAQPINCEIGMLQDRIFYGILCRWGVEQCGGGYIELDSIVGQTQILYTRSIMVKQEAISVEGDLENVKDGWCEVMIYCEFPLDLQGIPFTLCPVEIWCELV